MIRTRLLKIATLIIATVTILTACQPAEQESAEAITQISAPATAATATVPEFANVTDARLLNAASEPEQWMSNGGTYEERHHSPLDEINTENIDQLGLA
jgi:glucose dehydrogenase